MVVLLALAAAAGWGSSDYAAGTAARRSTALSVVIGTHVTAAVVLILASLDPIGLGFGAESSRVPTSDLGWGLAAGLAGGVGALFLYRGLARGSMAVVAPVTAAGAAVIPSAFGLLSGDPWTVLTVVGVALALGAIVLVSLTGAPDEAGQPGSIEPGSDPFTTPDVALLARANAAIAVLDRRSDPVDTRVGWAAVLTGFGAAVLAGVVATVTWATTGPDVDVPTPAVFLVSFGIVLILSVRAVDAGPLRAPGTRRLQRAGLSDALVSGVGFAMFFILTSEVSGTAGLWPMAAARSASAVVFAVVAFVFAGGMVPVRGTRIHVALAGVLDGVAAGCFLLSTRSGSLSVVSVLSSLYPVATVLLARVLGGERCTKRQLVAMGIAAVAVALITIG